MVQETQGNVVVLIIPDTKPKDLLVSSYSQKDATP